MHKDLLEEYHKFLNDRDGNDKKSKTVIVDGLNLFIRNFQAYPVMDDNGNHVGGVVGFFKSLEKIILNYSPTRLIVSFDGKGGSLRRRKILKEYKSKRLSSVKFNRFNDFKGIIDEKESQKYQIQLLLESLSNLPIYVIIIDNIEADDVISYLVTDALPLEDEKIIVSSDKDFLHLINDNISVYTHEKKALITKESMIETYGYLPLNYLTLRCFTGDRSDNIKGVKQVGEVGLKKHFNIDTLDGYITLDEIFEKSEEIISSGTKSKIFKNIIEQKDVAYRNYELMQLLDPNISGIIKSHIRSIIDNNPPRFNNLNIQKIFTDIGLCKTSYEFMFWSNYFNKLTNE